MTNTAGIFFSYSSQNDADYLLDGVALTGLDKIVLAIGGNIKLREMPDGRDQGKVVVLYEKDRLGKAESYNRALNCLQSDITFLVSGDVRYDPGIFSRLESYFQGEVGMVIPRVVPSPPKTFAESVGSIMWLIHDITMETANRESRYFCGGELQAVKHPMPLISPEIINDDEFLCHQVYASGNRIVYARDIEVVNFMPVDFRHLLQQRTRINYGHLQSQRFNNWHSSISLKGFREIRESVHILFTFLKRHRNQVFPLFVSIFLEIVSIILAKIQEYGGKSYRYWKLRPQE